MERTPHEFSDVTLRRLEVSDIDDFMEWATDEKTAKYCSWEPYTSKEDGIAYIKNYVIPHPWLRAICVNGKPVGSISVTKNTGNDACRGELGYAIGSAFWGRGIVTRAVKMVVGMIFEEWPQLERLEALVYVDNVGSQRVLEKAGFQREGVLRKYLVLKGRTWDMVMFSLLSTDPRDPPGLTRTFLLEDIGDVAFPRSIVVDDGARSQFAIYQTSREGIPSRGTLPLPQIFSHVVSCGRGLTRPAVVTLQEAERGPCTE